MTTLKTLFHRVATAVLIGAIIYSMIDAAPAMAKKPSPKAKFYNFDEQLIDGQVRTPTFTYFSVREKAKFERLLRLKKSFMRNLFDTSRDPVFK